MNNQMIIHDPSKRHWLKKLADAIFAYIQNYGVAPNMAEVNNRQGHLESVPAHAHGVVVWRDGRTLVDHVKLWHKEIGE